MSFANTSCREDAIQIIAGGSVAGLALMGSCATLDAAAGVGTFEAEILVLPSLAVIRGSERRNARQREQNSDLRNRRLGSEIGSCI